MQIKVIDIPWMKKLYGLSSIHDPNRSVGDEIKALLEPVWEIVRKHQISTTGINHVVYGVNGKYFCGVECPSLSQELQGLTSMRVTLGRYVYYKHIGPYSGIPKSYSEIVEEMGKMSLQPVPPSVEIYGHWNDDQTLLETELLLSFRKLP